MIHLFFKIAFISMAKLFEIIFYLEYFLLINFKVQLFNSLIITILNSVFFLGQENALLLSFHLSMKYSNYLFKFYHISFPISAQQDLLYTNFLIIKMIPFTFSFTNIKIAFNLINLTKNKNHKNLQTLKMEYFNPPQGQLLS